MEYIPAKTIVTRTKGESWFGTSYNMNIYRGCSHGCIYCDSRSECYGIKEFDKIGVKENALQTIRDDLRRKVKSGVIGTGAMSDPYNPLEMELELTRHSLELIDAYGFGVAIATKSSLIERDIDLLKEIATHSPVLCKITITTCDDDLSKKIEPFAPVSSRRFETIAKLSKAGLFAGILLMPVLPFLEDNPDNIRGIVKNAKESGAKFIYSAFGMTLRQNQRDWYFEKLDELFPSQSLVQQYKSRYGSSYNCVSPRARELWQIFKEECTKAGILYTMPDIIRASRLGYDAPQLTFF